MTMKPFKIPKWDDNNFAKFSPENENLDRYLLEINKIKLISIEEEIDLAKRIKLGDTVALEKLINANLRFVVSVAKTYQNQWLSLSDLINEWNIGLIKAAQRFDETNGFKFISYAVWRIRKYISEGLNETWRLIRLPINQIKLSNKIYKTKNILEQNFERKTTIKEIFEVLDIKYKDIKLLLEHNQKQIYFDTPIDNTDEHWPSYIDNFIIDQNPTDYLVTYTESLQQDIENVLSTLYWKEKEIIEYYFGLNGKSELSLENIGERFNLGKERTRQIKEKAIKKLKQPIISKHLKWYL